MASILLGFATALVYGFADFFGAIASKTIRSVAVTFLAAVSGLVFLSLVSPTLTFSFTTESVVWGITAGLTSAIAINSLYAALAIGPISIVSPLTAVLSAIVPALIGLAQGENFSGWGYLALGAILVAVILVGFIPGETVRLPNARGLTYSLIAGVGIGFVMVCLDAAPTSGGVATVLVLRLVSALTLGVSVWMSFRNNPGKQEFRVSNKVWFAIALAGIFDSSANVFFTIATRIGQLAVVSVLTALYPLGTILLARVFLKEKIAAVQFAGILLALAASALLAFNP